MRARHGWLQRLLRADRGATTAEYGMLIVLLAALALAALMLLERPVRELYGSVDDSVEEATSRGGGNHSDNSSCGQPPCGEGDGTGPSGPN